MGRRRRGRGVSTLLVILGLVAVLGGTFAAGFLAGRHWERVRVVTGLVTPQARKVPEQSASDRAVASRSAEPAPVPLTFYQELTAPLASPPPRPSKTEAPKPGRPEAAATPLPVSAPPANATSNDAGEPEGGRGFTVQVAAYASLAQAEKLAGRLTAGGAVADVSETMTRSGVRYRVRVGTYPTKEAAREAAARLAVDTGLGGFVATR